ncbi:unnamed protein product [Caenorhabditis sp. 36 PRJEB53466]|nr:unnamed protein product [Caenorhabditis sp. 36 PRJEB53466]
MFITLSYTTHTIISISLHVLGVVIGLFVWYLFPKHPTRSIVQLPSERVAVCIDRSPICTKTEQLMVPFHQNGQHLMHNNENAEKLIDFDDHHLPHISALRQFG